MVLVIYKALRPNLKVYSGYSILFFGFFFFFFYNFVLVPFIHLQTDVKWRKGTATKKPVCSCLNVGHFQGEDKGFTWFLKSPKGPSKNSAWLVDAKAKGLPFNG